MFSHPKDLVLFQNSTCIFEIVKSSKNVSIFFGPKCTSWQVSVPKIMTKFVGGGEAWLWGFRAPVGFRGRVLFFASSQCLSICKFLFRTGWANDMPVFSCSSVFLPMASCQLRVWAPNLCTTAATFGHDTLAVFVGDYFSGCTFFLVTGLGERTNDT